MIRALVSALAGYIAIGLLIGCTDMIWSALLLHTNNVAAFPPVYWQVSLATTALYTALGGYLCVRIAGPRWSLGRMTLIVAGEGIGLAFVLATWNNPIAGPHWYGLGLMIIFPPAIFLGGRLAQPRAATPVV
jgi:hypothetical protein